MIVGLTYDLQNDCADPLDGAEFDSEETIAAIEGAIQAMEHRAVRIGHAERLARSLLAGERWDLVFNIAEGRRGFGREALVPSLLDHFEIPYTFSDPLVCAVTLHKGAAKRWVRDVGIPTADFMVVESLGDLARLGATGLAFPLFAKPVAEGSSKGVDADSLVRTPEALEAVCARLLDRFRQPVLVERHLPGREVTVGVVGTGAAARTVGVLEVQLVGPADSAGYTYDNKKEWRERVRYRLTDDRFAEQAAAVALAAHRALGARDAARVDVRADEHGRPNFIEINPLPGLNPVTSDLPILWALGGRSYDDLIAAVIDSACARLAGVPEHRPGSCAACVS